MDSLTQTSALGTVRRAWTALSPAALSQRIQYPKLITLGFSFLLAYVLFRQGMFEGIVEIFNGRGYVSTFIAGVLYTFGFTAGFSIAIFAEVAHTVHPIPAAILAGAGAAIADMTLFKFIRCSFADEWLRLRQSRAIAMIRAIFERHTWMERAKHYGTWLLALFVIASPLPDEIGITILGGLAPFISGRRFALLCFILNTLGIYSVLIAARAVV